MSEIKTRVTLAVECDRQQVDIVFVPLDRRRFRFGALSTTRPDRIYPGLIALLTSRQCPLFEIGQFLLDISKVLIIIKLITFGYFRDSMIHGALILS